jgi:bacillolysin
MSNNSKATHFPVGKMLYALPDADPNESDTQHRLAYRFEVMRIEPSAYDAVYVDAVSGRILRIENLVKSCNPNTIDTFYNGNRTLETHWDGGRNRFQLKDYCRGGSIITKYSGFTSPLNTGWDKAVLIEASGSSSNPSATNWNWDYPAKASATSHWALQRAHDFFWNTFRRNGGANNNRQRRIEVDHPQQQGASYINWDGIDYFKVCRNPLNNNSMAELDIVAHEFTHSVTEFSANLQYRYESGALNESFSDIFGLMTERSVTGTMDWVLGSGAGYPRWFANLGTSVDRPAQSYLSTGAGWRFPTSHDGNDDYGWVHFNSGVQNRWFYLLSVGGTGDFRAVSNLVYRI